MKKASLFLGTALLLAACGGGGPQPLAPGDQTAPDVHLNAARSGTSVSLSAAATDSVGVTRVEFYRGAALIATDASVPYTATDTLAEGAGATYTARAYDAAGNVGQSVATLAARPQPGTDKTPPTVTLAGRPPTAPGAFTLWANAADDVGVARVEFYRGGTLVGSDDTFPYSAEIFLDQRDNGAIQFTARAYDADGNVGEGTLDATVAISSLYQGQYEWAAYTNPEDPAGSVVAQGVNVFADQASGQGIRAALGAYVDTLPEQDQVGPAILANVSASAGGPLLETVFGYDTADAATYLVGIDNDNTLGTFEGQPVFEGEGTIFNPDGTERNKTVYFVMVRTNENPYAGAGRAVESGRSGALKNLAVSGRARAFLGTLKGQPNGARPTPDTLNRLAQSARPFLR